MRLADPVSLAVKAGVASAIAVVATRALGIDDPLTAGFVGLACVSPSVTGGARSGFETIAGSALACAIAGAPLIAWPALRGSPVVLGVSLSAAVLLCFGLGLRSAYLVAGFSVVYLHVLPFDSATSGIALRIEAVLVGVLAATLLNLVESSLRAHAIAARRVRLAKAVVARELRDAGEWLASREDEPAPSFEAAFEVVRELRGDLEASARERLFPGARRAREHAERGLEEAVSLERAAHLAKEIAMLVHERARHDADERAAREVMEAAAGALLGERATSPKPEVSDPVLAGALERLRDAIGHS